MRRHLTYANVVSTLCLFIVLGGSAVAATQILPRNSVGTKQIRRHAITKAKLAPKLVSSLKGRRGVQGLQGPAGAGGQRGPQGDIGPAGPTFGDVAIAYGSAGQHA